MREERKGEGMFEFLWRWECRLRVSDGDESKYQKLLELHAGCSAPRCYKILFRAISFYRADCQSTRTVLSRPKALSWYSNTYYLSVWNREGVNEERGLWSITNVAQLTMCFTDSGHMEMKALKWVWNKTKRSRQRL